MIRKFIMGAALVLASCFLTASPAHAYNGAIKHYSPDNGLDTAIKVECDGGRIAYLGEGEASWESQNCPAGVHRVYNAGGEDIACLYHDPYTVEVNDWKRKFALSGWYVIDQNFGVGNYGCVKWAD